MTHPTHAIAWFEIPVCKAPHGLTLHGEWFAMSNHVTGISQVQGCG